MLVKQSDISWYLSGRTQVYLVGVTAEFSCWCGANGSLLMALLPSVASKYTIRRMCQTEFWTWNRKSYCIRSTWNIVSQHNYITLSVISLKLIIQWNSWCFVPLFCDMLTFLEGTLLQFLGPMVWDLRAHFSLSHSKMPIPHLFFPDIEQENSNMVIK